MKQITTDYKPKLLKKQFIVNYDTEKLSFNSPYDIEIYGDEMWIYITENTTDNYLFNEIEVLYDFNLIDKFEIVQFNRYEPLEFVETSKTVRFNEIEVKFKVCSGLISSDIEYRGDNIISADYEYPYYVINLEPNLSFTERVSNQIVINDGYSLKTLTVIQEPRPYVFEKSFTPSRFVDYNETQLKPGEIIPNNMFENMGGTFTATFRTNEEMFIRVRVSGRDTATVTCTDLACEEYLDLKEYVVTIRCPQSLYTNTIGNQSSLVYSLGKNPDVYVVMLGVRGKSMLIEPYITQIIPYDQTELSFSVISTKEMRGRNIIEFLYTSPINCTLIKSYECHLCSPLYDLRKFDLKVPKNNTKDDIKVYFTIKTPYNVYKNYFSIIQKAKP